MTIEGGNVRAAQGAPRDLTWSLVQGMAKGNIDIGAATPVLASLCVALWNTKGIIDGARSNKNELEQVLQLCAAYTVQVMSAAQDSKTFTFDVSLFHGYIIELGEVVKRHLAQGRVARLALSRTNVEDIRRLCADIKKAYPIMLAMILDISGETAAVFDDR